MIYSEDLVNKKLQDMREQEIPCNSEFSEGGWVFSSASNVVSAVYKPQEPINAPVDGRMATLPHKGWEFGRDDKNAKFIDYTFYPAAWHCLNCGFPEDPSERVENCCSSCGTEQ